MRYTQEMGKLLSKTELAPGVYNFVLSARSIAGAASAGQFVNVLCGSYQLRRPISIAGFDAERGILRLIFEVRGKGTDWLAGREAGEMLDLVGPLGHGFPLSDPSKKAVLVGGGIGTPPLLPPAQFYGANATVITGFRNGGARKDHPLHGRRLRRLPRLHHAGAGAGSGGKRLRRDLYLRPQGDDAGGGEAGRSEGRPLLCVHGGADGLRRRCLSGLCVPDKG